MLIVVCCAEGEGSREREGVWRLYDGEDGSGQGRLQGATKGDEDHHL